jgi:hypothetical protein
MRPIREITNKLHAAMEDGTLTPIQVAEAALRFLNESDVATMAHNEEFFLYEEEEEETSTCCGTWFESEVVDGFGRCSACHEMAGVHNEEMLFDEY